MPANLSDLFPSSGGGSLPGGMTKDPRFLPMVDGTNVLFAASTSGAGNTPDSATFWGGTILGFASIGAVLSTANDNTYGTICDLTGRGYLFHVIPPLHAAATDTISFRITVDGTEYLIEKTGQLYSTSQAGRLVLGCASPLGGGESSFFTGQNIAGFGQDNGSTIGSFRFSGNAMLFQPWRILMEGRPCVYFEESLKVETKVSALGASGTYCQYSAATYKLLGGSP